MSETPIGDLVLFEDDERLDAVDARALQVLIYQCIADALGGLMGETSGVLGGVTFTGTAASMAVGECTLCGFKRVSGSDARVEGVILHYDPAGAYQSVTTIPSMLSYTPDTDFPYVWFARAETEADRATRKKFQAGRERTITPLTRLRQNVRFGVTIDRDTPPDTVYDWFVFGQVSDWSGVTPVITAISPFDIGYKPSVEYAQQFFVGATVRAINESQPGVDGFGGPWHNGLARIITYLGHVLGQTRSAAQAIGPDGDIGTPSATGPLPIDLDSVGRGITNLDEDLAALETRIDTIELNGIGTGQLLYIGRATYDGGLTAYVLTEIWASNIIEVTGSSQAWADAGTGAKLLRLAITRNGDGDSLVVKTITVQPLATYISIDDLGPIATTPATYFPVFPMIAIGVTLPKNVTGAMYAPIGLVRHASADATDFEAHNGDFLVHVFGGSS